MFLTGSLRDAGNRFLERLLTEFAHLLQDGFKSALIGDGIFVERRLFGRKSQADGLGVDLACQPPGSRRLSHQRALGDPPQFQQLFLQALVMGLESSQGCRR